MGTIKTAISIDADTFRRVERLSRKLRISRSQFFTQAARHMIEKDENLELLQKINAAFEPDDEEDARRRAEKSYAGTRADGKW